ncbi:sensor histidine kinase [Paenibacillus sp. NEAU-GSW1]|uniref:sensor histidine kinase n=1 Tax=Paenibacillus sp. NEAU-GSW1 TaxID=2682486 RepID=UPI0020A62DB9|nr:histidine kinase [Paenibacillus sp. NEAU-GSW1]
MYRPEFSLRNTIFLRLIITFLLILLPIILFGVYQYHSIMQSASSDITKSATSQINFYLSDLENEIERIKLLQYSLLEDENLNELALTWERMDTIERTESMNLIMKRLFTVQNSSMYIKDVSVHIASIGRTMSAEDGVRDLDVQRFKDIRSVYGGKDSQIMEWNGRLFLGFAKLRGIKGAEPFFTVEIELDVQRLRDALAQFNTYSGSGTVLLSENAKVALTSGTGELAEANMPQYILQMQMQSDDPLEAQPVTIEGKEYYSLMAHSSKLELSIYRFIPEQVVQQPLRKFYNLAWVFAAAALAITAAFAMATYRFIHKPMLTLVKSFRKMENGDLDIHIAHESKDEFRYLYGRFNQMVANLRSSIDQAYKQKILAQRAELKQLQAQINPHFLYNSFFILNTMARTGDVERIEQFTTLLGEYFQFVTRNASDMVSLEQEIHHARMYTEIQEMRFSRRVSVRFDALPEELRKLQVPRLIIQPIIENAFEHSLEKKMKDGVIVVRFLSNEGMVGVIVEDNGGRLTDEAMERIAEALQHEDDRSETTGMVNIHRRIRITSGDGCGLITEPSELGGLKVTIVLSVGGEHENVQDANR